MRHLVIAAHPNTKSFNRAVVETFVTALEERKHRVECRDLYAAHFNPIISARRRIHSSQQKDTQSEKLIRGRLVASSRCGAHRQSLDNVVRISLFDSQRVSSAQKHLIGSCSC